MKSNINNDIDFFNISVTFILETMHALVFTT